MLFLVLPVFCSAAEPHSAAQPQCTTTPCPHKVLQTKNIADCPDEGCVDPKTNKGHKFDPQLDKLKNLRSDERKPDLQSFERLKGLPTPSPTDYSKCGNRAALEQIGEGQKITVMAWALKAETQGPESCNCDLPGAENHDTHIVLVDPMLKDPQWRICPTSRPPTSLSAKASALRGVCAMSLRQSPHWHGVFQAMSTPG